MKVDGKKTYIIAAVFFLAGIAKTQGWIDGETYNNIFMFLVPGGLWTLRDGIKKTEKGNTGNSGN